MLRDRYCSAICAGQVTCCISLPITLCDFHSYGKIHPLFGRPSRRPNTLRNCSKAGCYHGVPVPLAFWAALDDEADGADLDFTAGQFMTEGRDEWLGRLPRRAVAQGDVRGLNRAVSRPPGGTSHFMSRGARSVKDREEGISWAGRQHDGLRVVEDLAEGDRYRGSPGQQP